MDVVRYIEKVRGGSVEYLDELLRHAVRLGDEDLIETFELTLPAALEGLSLPLVVDICLAYLGDIREERDRLLAFRSLYEACSDDLREAYRVAAAAVGEERARKGFHRAWCRDRELTERVNFADISSQMRHLAVDIALTVLASEEPVESPLDLARRVGGENPSTRWKQEFFRALRLYGDLRFRPARLAPGKWKLPPLQPIALSPFGFVGEYDHFGNKEKQKIIAQYLASPQGRQRLASQMTMPLRRHRDYADIGRRSFPIQQLPEPVVPVFSAEPDEDQ